MDLKNVQKHWNAFAEKHALWAILTRGSKPKEWSTSEFFGTGVEEINNTLAWVRDLGLIIRFGKALDFGCGVGRLTQALCLHFGECYGVDISPAMIELARQFNAHPQKCHYVLNEGNDLTVFQSNSFDFIYSSLVLQHVEPRYSKQYIKEFLRILAPGGVLVFQLPNRRGGDRLPGEAFKAHITVRAAPASASSDSEVELFITVKNESPVAWPSVGGKYPVSLANHWLSADGNNLLVNDDGRSVLDQELGPGEEVDLSILIHTPSKPGSYYVELDMVQELITWFKDQGSPTTRFKMVIYPSVKMAVRDASFDKRGSEPPRFEPVMEMYEVSSEEVFDLIRLSGGHLIATEEKRMGTWNSCTYCVTKRATD